MNVPLTRILSLTILALVGGQAWSQDADRSFGDGALPTFLIPYDVNNDGTLSVEERQVMLDERDRRREDSFSKWDTDQDGELSDYERAHAQNENLAIMVAKRQERFTEVDLNADGVLSLMEFRQIPGTDVLAAEVLQSVFERLDVNRDGNVSVQEFLDALQNRPAEAKPNASGKSDSVAIADLPGIVLQTLNAQRENVIIERAKKKQVTDRIVYEIRGHVGISDCRAWIAEDGTLVNWEYEADGIALSEVPEHVINALKARLGSDIVIDKAELENQNGLLYYEMEGHTASGVQFKADVWDQGTIVSLELKDDDEAPIVANDGNPVQGQMAPISITGLSYIMNDGGESSERLHFLSDTSGEKSDLAGNDRDNFTYAYTKVTGTTATVRVQFKEDKWDDYSLDYASGTFTRQEFDDDKLKDTDSGTFSAP